MFDEEANDVWGEDSRPEDVPPSTDPPASSTHATSQIHSTTASTPLATYSQSLPVNSLSQPGLFGSNYGGLPPALADVRQVRNRVPTLRGREYQMDVLTKRSTMVARRIKQQVTILDGHE